MTQVTEVLEQASSKVEVDSTNAERQVNEVTNTLEALIKLRAQLVHKHLLRCGIEECRPAGHTYARAVHAPTCKSVIAGDISRGKRGYKYIFIYEEEG